MIMSLIWVGILLISIVSAMVHGTGAALSAAVLQGAQTGVSLAISIAGALCLWAGIGRLMQAAGITAMLSRIMKPALNVLFPSTKTDASLAGELSTNICANLLGLGNAATPPGIAAAKRLAAQCRNQTASNELCRLIVLNTASIQLIPANVAAVRSALGCKTPFDILPAVWLTSACSAGLGLAAAWALGKLWTDA